MTYELALKLKSAGFPQKAGKYLLDNGVSGDTDTAGSPYKTGVFIPTLSELIEACGYGFRSLSKHSDGRWIAKSGANTGKFLTSSKHSAEEAVAKLWLKLSTL